MENEKSKEEAKRGLRERLWKLQKQANCSSVREFAQYLDMNRQNIDRYINGDRFPDYSTIIQICTRMNVSADWLLGLSDVCQLSAEMRAVCEYTGLSEKAVEKIRCPEVGNPAGKTLARMIETQHFDNLITLYKIFLSFLDRIKESDLNGITPWQELGDGNVTLGPNEATNHFKQEVITAMAHICEDNYAERVEMIIQDVPEPFEVSMGADGYVIQRLHDEETGKE